MIDLNLPDLTFPSMIYGKEEIPRDLRRWLFKGGAATNSRVVIAKIASGELGQPLTERFESVCAIHEVLTNNFDRGASRETINSQIHKLNQLFRWFDDTNYALTLASFEDGYLQWTDALVHRIRIANNISEKAAYDCGSIVGWIVDRIFERATPIVRTTRLRSVKRGARAVSIQTEKQDLEKTFAMGHFLLDLSDGLSLKTIWGPLPVRIQLRNGSVLEEWSGPKRGPQKPPNPKYLASAKHYARISEKLRTTWEIETSFRTRYPLINLRIQAEMFMLMGQPAVNLAQAYQLRMDQWRYKASTHGYEIRTYKNRRWGPVVFEIYSQYRKIFERYLKWRAAIFPDDPDGLLFPLLGKGGNQSGRHPHKSPYFDKIKECCVRAGIDYLSPRELRNTNVNWMLRRTQDPDLTADEKQHTTKTLLGVYEKPSLQRSMVQIKGYWAKYDPAQAAAGPGACSDRAPEPIADMPAIAPKPDCVTPSGCLFCTNQRDIDHFDHVWSLSSFRLLKSFELAGQATPERKNANLEHPAETVIKRISAKLTYIADSDSSRNEWVAEALIRIEEGRYHPLWAGAIESL